MDNRKRDKGESIDMKKILFATENESKVKRFKKGLLENGIEIITINDLDKKIEVDENGKDAIENAIIKARAYSNTTDLPVLAMDDNLYIDDIPDDKRHECLLEELMVKD